MSDSNLFTDESQLDDLVSQIESESNLVKGALFGLIGGLIGAGLWAIITKLTGYNLGLVAIGVGWCVAKGFKIAGRSTKQIAGIIAGLIALLSILAGEVLHIAILISEYYDVSMYDVFASLGIAEFMSILAEDFNARSVIFYLIAVQVAFKGSYINPYKIEPMKVRETVGSVSGSELE